MSELGFDYTGIGRAAAADAVESEQQGLKTLTSLAA
jgi:hypothetical protein